MADAIYIYYRVDPDRESAAGPLIEALLRDIEARTGVRGRLLRKHGEPLLWMEVYDPVPNLDAFRAALQETECRLRIDTLLQTASTRKIEHFHPCA